VGCSAINPYGYIKRPELRNMTNKEQESLFNAEYSVGELAKEFFSCEEEIMFSADDFGGMISKQKSSSKTGTLRLPSSP